MRQLSLPKAVLAGGLLGGALDLAFAVAFAAYKGATPTRVFQVIASGVLGDAAFTGDPLISAFGVACHFALSILWAALFAAVASRFELLTRRPLFVAIGFGLVVFLCMRLIVLPLSAYPYPVTFKPLGTSLDLLSHMLLFAGPIVVITGRALSRRSG